ncbi:MAG: sporulation protein YabP [Oscillospiraceae bacterium]|nr:sporulation protein YabP [Oscillospiraceae bacterium]
MQKTGEDKKNGMLPHNVFLENRSMMNLSGVEDVDCFDEQTIRVFTNMGEMTVRGRGLHINKLSVDTGELSLEGKIDLLEYSDEQKRSGGLFSKLFR